MSVRKQIGLCLIATGKYKQFVEELVKSIGDNFLKEHDVTVFLFTDDMNAVYQVPYYPRELGFIKVEIPPYRFPQATLYRYSIFWQNRMLFDQLDHLFYMDVDMRVENEVGDEILIKGLVAVQHPGFYRGGWGSPNCDKRSTAYLPKQKQQKYYAGGFQGGQKDFYLDACMKLAINISRDVKSGVMAEWHDETHWNAYTHTQDVPLLVLSPAYCVVEDIQRRKAWKINHIDPKIIALNKNHEEVRK